MPEDLRLGNIEIRKRTRFFQLINRYQHEIDGRQYILVEDVRAHTMPEHAQSIPGSTIKTLEKMG